MVHKLPTLRELAEELNSNGAQVLRLDEELLRQGSILLTGHGNPNQLGPDTDRYRQLRETHHVRVNEEEYVFDYEYDPYGPSTFGSILLYVAEPSGVPTGLDATTLECGLRTISALTGDSR